MTKKTGVGPVCKSKDLIASNYDSLKLSAFSVIRANQIMRRLKSIKQAFFWKLYKN